MRFSDPLVEEGRPVIGVTPTTDHDRRYMKAVLVDHDSPLADDYSGQTVLFDMTNLFSYLVPVRLLSGTAETVNPKTKKDEPTEDTPDGQEPE